eukprot:CAMPEP_0183308816 /NCGR_PEP_ID=MMETSP0160_2-20130417/22522_1 /TAXON_ID=2839 ORGANISM="Odontella Sinensis, Strain Grunow 1884" /NCGR_SAMPLE_ID=MMETSP0160_2 /ASSEMBLY_ACC=CAM_ASM_000250 /LENGTH=117 /DNA_ID=CAMNT_0025472719 /DNA_START=58 /DNA_END=411 /DNA_ORIENTATION=+
MSQQQQEDGYYPRLNSSLLSSGRHAGMIVSLVGKVASSDGSVARFLCADGGVVRVLVEPDFSVGPNVAVEVVGAANEDGTVQHFVTRELGSDFDLDVYNKMLEVQHDPRFAEYFTPI